MPDVEVEVTSDEVEAEILRGRLEAEGIPARVAYRSQIGWPRGWSPAGLGFGIGSFSVRVPEEYADQAREVLGPREPVPVPAATRSKVVTLIAMVLLIYFLMGSAYSLSWMLPELFR